MYRLFLSHLRYEVGFQNPLANTKKNVDGSGSYINNMHTQPSKPHNDYKFHMNYNISYGQQLIYPIKPTPTHSYLKFFNAWEKPPKTNTPTTPPTSQI